MNNALSIEPDPIVLADVQPSELESLETNLPFEGTDIQQATSGLSQSNYYHERCVYYVCHSPPNQFTCRNNSAPS